MDNKIKKDPELKRQIKKMEDERRKEAGPIDSAPEDKENKISFDTWWVMINNKCPMRPHLKEILLADFQSRGLSKLETEQRYDDTLRVFGIKW
jgi:hypothetical protein